MNNHKPLPAVAIIPARFNSTRFPGKPLALLEGRTMIEMVYRSAAASRVGRTVVATDDPRIAREVERFGGEVMITSSSHHSGTERVEEASRGMEAEVVVNVQGDEPFIRPGMIDQLAEELLNDSSLDTVTLTKEIDSEAEYHDPGVVKVVTDSSGFALYFSRAPIPYRKNKMEAPPYKHVGVYGFRKGFLRRFVSWPPGRLETEEGLEQLRILENGHKIKTLVTAWNTIGIDTPEDLRRALERLKKERGDD